MVHTEGAALWVAGERASACSPVSRASFRAEGSHSWLWWRRCLPAGSIRALHGARGGGRIPHGTQDGPGPPLQPSAPARLESSILSFRMRFRTPGICGPAQDLPVSVARCGNNIALEELTKPQWSVVCDFRICESSQDSKCSHQSGVCIGRFWHSWQDHTVAGIQRQYQYGYQPA